MIYRFRDALDLFLLEAMAGFLKRQQKDSSKNVLEHSLMTLQKKLFSDKLLIIFLIKLIDRLPPKPFF